jgi:hypothetical protein
MLTSKRAKVQWETLQSTVDTTTPENLLASLHRQLPKFQRSASDLPPATRDALKHFGATDSAALAEKISSMDYALWCLEALLPRLSRETQELVRNGQILVAEINSDFPAAQMWHCDDGRFAIVFTRELHQVYYRLIRALCTRLSPSNSEEASLPFEKTCEIVSDIAFWYKNSLESTGPSYPITPNQLMMASRITKEAMVFCLAHELSHAVFRLHSALAQFAQNGKEEELSADVFALGALMSTPEGGADSEFPQISFSGAEMFLRVQIIFERLGLEFYFGEHPTFRERLVYLRLMLSQLCQSPDSLRNISSASDCFATLCEKVFEHLNDSTKEEKALTRAAQSHMAELDVLLEQCTGGFVPDYATFYPKASEMLQQPGSEMFFKVMNRCTQDFANICASKTKTSSDADRWRSFQKYKLFLGLTQHLNEPVRSMFMAALQNTVSEQPS